MKNYWETIGDPGPVGSYAIVSGDTHLVEPKDLWENYIDKKYLDRAPRVAPVGERDFWFCEGMNLMHTGHKGTRWDYQQYSGKYEEQRGMVSDQCLADSDADGIDVNVFFPSAPITFYAVPDPDLTLAIFRAYHDWQAEFCSADPRRLKGLAALLLPDRLDAAIAELERGVGMGFVGGLIPMLSRPDVTYDNPVYDRLWETAVGLGVPLTFHTGAIRYVDATRPAPPNPGIPPFGRGGADALVRDNLTDMIYGGVFERFPDLRVGSMEMSTGWVAHYMRTMDRGYVVRREPVPRPKEFVDGMVPSDFVRRNVFFSFMDEDLGVLDRDIIGVDNLMYANDYPHPDCVWPRSQQVLERLLETSGCTEEEKVKLSGGNAARIFGLELA